MTNSISISRQMTQRARRTRHAAVSVLGLAVLCLQAATGSLIVPDNDYVGTVRSKTRRSGDGSTVSCSTSTLSQFPVRLKVDGGKITMEGEQKSLGGGLYLHGWNGTVNYEVTSFDQDILMTNSTADKWPANGCGRMFQYSGLYEAYTEVYWGERRDGNDNPSCSEGLLISVPACSGAERLEVFQGVPRRVGWEAEPFGSCKGSDVPTSYAGVDLPAGCASTTVRSAPACRDSVGTNLSSTECADITPPASSVGCLHRTPSCIANLNLTDPQVRDIAERAGGAVPSDLEGGWEGFHFTRSVRYNGGYLQSQYEQLQIANLSFLPAPADDDVPGAPQVIFNRPSGSLYSYDGVIPSSAVDWPFGLEKYYITQYRDGVLSMSKSSDANAETRADLTQWRIAFDVEDEDVPMYLDGGSRTMTIPIAWGHPEMATRFGGDELPRNSKTSVYPTWDYQVSTLRLTPAPVYYKPQPFAACAYFAQSVSCERRREAARCTNADDEEVDELFCLNLEELPADSVSCTGCVHWEVGNWSTCSLECNSGVRTRSVVCKDQSGRTAGDNACLSLNAGAKPITSEPCNTLPCAAWVNGSWSECSATCGPGQITRSVQCIDTTGAVVPPSEVSDRCGNDKPVDSLPCQRCPCEPAGRDYTIETFIPPAVAAMNARFLVDGGAADDDDAAQTTTSGHPTADAWTSAADVCPPGSELITRDQLFCHTSTAISTMCGAIQAAASASDLRVGFKIPDDATDIPKVPDWLKDSNPDIYGAADKTPSIERHIVDSTCTFRTTNQGSRAFVSQARQSMVALCRETS